MQIEYYDKKAYQEYTVKSPLSDKEKNWLMIFIEKAEEGLEYHIKYEFKNISLRTHASGNKKQNIDLRFLTNMTHCISLDCGIPLSKKVDISPIYSLTNLEYLTTIKGFKIDVSYFPKLKHLYAAGLSEDTLNYETLTKLTVLSTSPNTKDLKLLENLKSLEYIGIYGNNIESLNGLRLLPKLQQVIIGHASKIQNIEDIALNSNIKDVFIENTKRLTDFSVLAKSESITDLRLATEIDSLEFVPKMKSLKSITFGNVKDGDLKPLLESKTLEDVYFYPEKRHFTHKLDEINEILEKRNL
jgi:internalin A